jgi:protoporphyrinogen oxidase
VWARVRPPKNEDNYENWLVARFGWRLYRTFFKTYTERVWGVPVSDMPADWAAQRVKNLDLRKAVINAILPKRNQTEITSLIEEFQYPKYGPGMMWEVCAEKVQAAGGTVTLDAPVVAINIADGLARSVVYEHNGKRTELAASHVISTMPMRELVASLTPPPPAEVLAAGEGLHYRDYLTVALVVPESRSFPDNWIYIHDPGVRVGRIQNFKSWSPEMVPGPGLNCYGLEYFCFEGDGLWSSADSELVRLASDELVQLGLAKREDIADGTVVRQPKAYPVYDEGYQQRVATIRAEIEAKYPTLHLVGRNGMHKYNNQDHAMMTAMLTVRNIMLGRRAFDVWLVNQDAEYHEAGEAGAETSLVGAETPASAGRLVPLRA